MLCGDGRGFELRVLRADGRMAYAEPVEGVVYAIHVRAPQLQREQRDDRFTATTVNT